MQIAQETRSGWNVVTLTGRADALAAQELEDVLSAASKASSKIAVDLSALVYISSAGLRSLLQGARAAQTNECEFVICGARDAVKNVFEISGIQNILRGRGRAAMLSILEQTVLLALDEQTGKLQSAQGFNTGYALAGAAFFDLALAKKIDSDIESVQVLDAAPTGNEVLDFCLTEMAKYPEKRTVRAWIEELMLYGEFFEDSALKSLIDQGILRHETSKMLWIIDVESFPVVDDKPGHDVKLRLAQTVLSDDIPSTEDIMLVSAAEASGLLGVVLSQQELDGRQERIRTLCGLDAIGRAVLEAIRELDLNIRSAVMTSY